MELKKFSDEVKDSSALSWLLAKENHALEENDLSKLVRNLILKHDAMVDYIKELEQKI